MTTRMCAGIAILVACAGALVSAQQQGPAARGPEDAATQIEVFLSFEDGASARASVVLDALMEQHPDSVRLVFRHVAAEEDAAAVLVHRAALAAAAQSRFWEMAQLLFANQQRHARGDLIAMAGQLRLNLHRFAAELDAAAADGILAADRVRAAKLGIETAPAYIINGKLTAEPQTLAELEALIGAVK